MIICSAIRMHDGYIIRGHRHNDCIRTAREIPRYKNEIITQKQQGFMSSENEFVDRKLARRIEETNRVQEGRVFTPFHHDELLFSEDIY